MDGLPELVKRDRLYETRMNTQFHHYCEASRLKTVKIVWSPGYDVGEVTSLLGATGHRVNARKKITFVFILFVTVLLSNNIIFLRGLLYFYFILTRGQFIQQLIMVI